MVAGLTGFTLAAGTREAPRRHPFARRAAPSIFVGRDARAAIRTRRRAVISRHTPRLPSRLRAQVYEDAVIVIDEGHNVPSVARDAASYEMASRIEKRWWDLFVVGSCELSGSCEPVARVSLVRRSRLSSSARVVRLSMPGAIRRRIGSPTS